MFRTNRRDARQRTAARLIAEGDAHRDASAWREAIDRYRAALALLPDTGIVVQLGHCLKEDGCLDEALALYRHALAQRPWDDDLHCQIADAERRRGNADAASRHFRAALALNRSNGAARHEADTAVAPVGGGASDVAPAIVILPRRSRAAAASPFEREVGGIAESLSGPF